VAEIGPKEKKELVGMIRGCIKTVTCGITTKRLDLTHNKSQNDVVITKPLYTKLAYILGLRVSPTHRYVLIKSHAFNAKPITSN